MPEIKVKPLGYACGAEITGVDLRKPLDGEAFKVIKQASLDHLVICIRGQELTREHMLEYGGRFGVVDDNSSVKHRDPVNPYVTMISSKPYEGKPWDNFKNGEHWHTDRSFKVGPTSYTILHAKELPDVGGNTLFANQYLAYDTLSPKLREFVDGLTSVHLQQRKAAMLMVKQFPAVVHPLARPHPETGRKALYIGEHVRSFLDMTEEESQPLLAYLMNHATRAEFCYRHVWRVGDVVMFDNRSLMHMAVKDYDMRPGAQPRHLWKASVQGEETGKLYEEVVGRRYPLEISERGA
ncbi:MAG TPA: TauD/TfdA family dioxygenase [Ramlibacter sp.]|nr:TauD/TfdA family dioxygenase [Ramlibacter sp.]